MKLKDAIYYAAMFLRLDDVCEALEGGSASAEANKEVARLVRIANLVINEATRDFLPLKTSEKLFIGADGLSFSALSRKLGDIYAVIDAQGRSVPVKRYYDFFTVPAPGEYTICYSYVPAPAALDDDVETGKLCERVLAYGICAEYSVISGESADAVLWDGRYKDALAARTEDKHEKRVAKRKWL